MYPYVFATVVVSVVVVGFVAYTVCNEILNEPIPEQEEQLLEKLSYLNVLEQELHSRAKEIENEERILREREQELENRKQHLQSISSKSSSDSDLTNTTHTTNTQTNTSATNTVLDNNSSDEISLKGVVEQHSLNNENSIYPDTAAQAILSQDLSIIKDAWSEIESINSEDIGSEMSSAVDIDIEEVDVIEH
ncbi:6649_t:CDS:2 [Entrophospora sp. SA101]|nr:14854_t:CDS:2 [Entrophospora sp. SA101]CAJ0858116.1 6649_t:CDS:2 [Entrophospora sp. SA101]